MIDFEIGEKVVCIDDQPHHISGFPLSWKNLKKYIKCGKIYTIENIIIVPKLKANENYPFSGTISLILVGHPNIVNKIDNIDIGWNSNRFEKLPKKKTDISIFKEILLKADKGVLVDV